MTLPLPPCAFVQPVAAAIGALTIATVMFGIVLLFFKIQNALTLGGIRSDPEEELEGLDLGEMGVLAYPEFYGSSPNVETTINGHVEPVPEPVVSGQERSR